MEHRAHIQMKTNYSLLEIQVSRVWVQLHLLIELNPFSLQLHLLIELNPVSQHMDTDRQH